MATTYAIPDGRVAFNISLSNTGTTANGGGVAKVISGLAFQPDMVWSKNRSSSTNARWGVIDSVRGVNKTIATNLTNAEVTSQTDLLTSFNSDGANIGADAGGYGWNWNQQSGASDNYAYWLWKAGGTAVSNTAGSITSSVSANTTAGFSVVTYTGTGANATVGHGLGVAPSMVIVKSRSVVENWPVYHASMNASPATGRLILDGTAAFTSSPTTWNNTAPTSTVFSIGTASAPNTNASTNVAYCFAPVAGYSAFGSYTGNGSNDGPFIYTGFRPRFLLIKNTTTAGTNWEIWDSARDLYNVESNRLYPDSSAAESTGQSAYDFLSNGFKARQGGATDSNQSGATIVYAAFGETAFKFSNAR